MSREKQGEGEGAGGEVENLNASTVELVPEHYICIRRASLDE